MNFAIAEALNDIAGYDQGLRELARFVAQDLIFIVFAIFALILVPVVRAGRWHVLGCVLGTLVVAYLLGSAAAHLYGESRPFTTHRPIVNFIGHPAGQSFPSDHATAAYAIAAAVLVFVSVRYGVLLLGLATIIGFGRVAAGVHYPGDVVGSLMVAFVAVAVVGAGTRLAARRSAAHTFGVGGSG